jgi:hypothetical protein
LTKRRSALTLNFPYAASSPSLHSPTSLNPFAHPSSLPLSPTSPNSHVTSPGSQTAYASSPPPALSRSHSERRIRGSPKANAGREQRADQQYVNIQDGHVEERKRDASGENRYPPNSFVLGYGWGFGRMRKARKEKKTEEGKRASSKQLEERRVTLRYSRAVACQRRVRCLY